MLLELLRDSETDNGEYVRRRYAEQAVAFEHTIRFLTALGCIEDCGSTIRADRRMLECSNVPSTLRAELVRRIGESQTGVRQELQRFFSNFDVAADQLVYEPIAQNRSVDSHLRNLLMELEVIRHDAACDAYVLNPTHYNLYKKAAPRPPVVAPEISAARRVDTGELGTDAELVVVAYENERLGPDFAGDIEHVSLTDASAGYDVASVTVIGDRVTPRLIEVKAVPAKSFRFYWSANEVASARWFGSWYFLYLVPVVGTNEFDIGKIRQICNPCATVFSADDWNVSTDVYKCELALDASCGTNNSEAARE
jgi:hypothetical protein